ncbi:MAG: bifunctional proline dehydrogenase/L-glutamate gamma-semialdehyde dehydrogenase [Mangrovibacterium sp.]
MQKIKPQEVHDWASQFLLMAEKELTHAEIKEQKKYADLVQNPNDKILLSKMLDESSQLRNDTKLSARIKSLIEQYGVPKFFNKRDTLLLKIFSSFGYRFESIAIPIFKSKLRKDTDQVIIPEERPILTRHLSGRATESVGQNVNLLGEVVLGNTEANHRYQHYLEALKEPDINYISIKISGIYAQLYPLNYKRSKEELCHRIAEIYRQSIKYPYTDASGKTVSKFVNLDMEEYKDSELTLEVFLNVLAMPEFKNYTAGIVIQAYLPDAWEFQTKLLDFAKKRVEEGGSPIKMRLVKGANLQMESIVSSLRGWNNPVLPTKVAVDANYMRILDRALLPENAKALHVGVASHNFFSIGYAHLLSKENGIEDCVSFEMLEGMANHLPRAMRKLEKQVILYTPVVRKEHFLNAVSYLVRRLDENTGKDNFLSYSFNLKVDSKEWEFLYNQFQAAYALKDEAIPSSNRKQNRLLEIIENSVERPAGVFRNEPDTNFDLPANREWAEKIRESWQNRPAPDFKKADIEDVNSILNAAEDDKSEWRKSSMQKRMEILHHVAENLSKSRGDLIGCMAATTGKTFMEGDVEVSEAIDFCRFYPSTMKEFDDLKTVNNSPKGVVLVISPWNFPLAIPIGGVAAALSGGNNVILKPATVAYPIALEFAKCFWNAGVPKDVLQLVCCNGREALNTLTASPIIKHTILTGGTDTAFSLLKNNPTCPLSAETGGKNAIILTESGDMDHAILNIVSSAFGNAGQKCSACSLLLVEKGIYDNPEFKSKLKDAVTSMQTGSPWEFNNIIGPMITNNNDKLLHAIETLEEGESWLVEPEFIDEEKYMLKPSVKWGVRPDSFTFKTELFAPLLAVVRIDSLEQGIKFVNSSAYGLTSGLQSLDENEQALWKNTIEAGNLYINRGTTGAIVNRQPFGGMKLSSFGGGVKAGGVNYTSCFVKFSETEISKKDIKINDQYKALCEYLPKEERSRLIYAADSYLQHWKEEFSKERDVNNILGESNTFRYIPIKSCALRLRGNEDLCDIMMVAIACSITGTKLTISHNLQELGFGEVKSLFDLLKTEVKKQSEDEFIDELQQYERIRTFSNEISEAIYNKAAEHGKYIATHKAVKEGRIELLHYLKEQSISYEYHRYGSILE